MDRRHETAGVVGADGDETEVETAEVGANFFKSWTDGVRGVDGVLTIGDGAIAWISNEQRGIQSKRLQENGE